MRALLLASALLALAGCPTPRDPKETGQVGEDADNDGWTHDDCDDSDPNVNPAASEVCDGVDNNCDGQVDEGLQNTWYQDADQDGYGNEAVTTTACEKPEGYVPNGTDCDDTNPAAFPGNLEVCDGADNNCDGQVDEGVTTTFYADADGDGYGDPTLPTEACEQPTGMVADATDCDDLAAGSHPGGTEVCDGRDNDCDGVVDDGVSTPYYEDGDGDGWGDPASAIQGCATAPSGYVALGGDCDDINADINPAAAEVCDGDDDDCDGVVDDGALKTYYQDADNDGWGDASVAREACRESFGWSTLSGDCDDVRDSIYPGATEICDGKDNDCDGTTDEPDAVDVDVFYRDADGDGHGDPTRTESACSAPVGYVAEGDDCDDTEALVNPAQFEICDGLDNDCDGATDEADAVDPATWYADADGDGFGDAALSTVACTAPTGYVGNDDDCDDTVAAANPGATELCDGVDNDCDGTVDEADAADARTWYVDADDDGYGNPRYPLTTCGTPTGYAENDDDCNDAAPTASPAGTEVCDGLDNDCDGTIDEPDAVDADTWYTDADGDGYGDASSPTAACVAPTGTVADATDCDDTTAEAHPRAGEVCDGLDNDCDGTVDEADAADATAWYVDADGDGWGSDAATTLACTPPPGWVGNAEDCDDADATDHPSAPEICDGDDDDCDGAVDEDDAADATTWHRDADGDTWGDPAVTDVACSAPSGYVADGTDCDDTDPSRHPGADEEWYDLVDSDCDGNLDPDACIEPPPEGTITASTSCTYTPLVGTFDPIAEWSMSSFTYRSTSREIIMAPMVANLTDDNLDGVIDTGDTPDVVVITHSSADGLNGVLRIISGDGTRVHASTYDDSYSSTVYYPYRYSNLAIGDIDLDGEGEIATTVVNAAGTCYAGVYDADAELEWVYTGSAIYCGANGPALADLDADGSPEVIFGRLFLHADGTLHAQGTGGWGYYSGYSNAGYHQAVADLDGDGDLEVVAGSSVYDKDGKTVCSTANDGYSAVADLDNDGYGEFVVSGNGSIRTFERDCTAIASWSVYGGGYGGPATIADFDGDGVVEIGLPGKAYYSVYEVDGTRLWANVISDYSSHSTGSSVFDFDGNGAAEVVYADEKNLWVYDGATGAIVYSDTMHGSGTVNDYPTIADVDGDGKAEIVLGNDDEAGGKTGLYLVGDSTDGWVSARMLWNQHGYNITNINDDLTIPRVPTSNWPTYNSYRQGAPGGFDPQSAVDVYPYTYEACQDACGGDVTLVVQVGNEGSIRASADLVVSIYGDDGTGTRTLLDSTTLGSVLEPGVISPAFLFVLAAVDVQPYAALYAVVDDDAASNECDETDNSGGIDVGSLCW